MALKYREEVLGSYELSGKVLVTTSHGVCYLRLNGSAKEKQVWQKREQFVNLHEWYTCVMFFHFLCTFEIGKIKSGKKRGFCDHISKIIPSQSLNDFPILLSCHLLWEFLIF